MGTNYPRSSNGVGNAQAAWPSFFFQINKLEAYPNDPPLYTPSGIWYPPRTPRQNRLIAGDTTNQLYFFDGFRQRTTRYPPQLPQGVEPFRTYSVYYHSTLGGFWTVNDDVSQFPAASGQQSGYGQAYASPVMGGGNHWRTDWKQLGFARGPGNYEQLRTSFLTCASESCTLYFQRETQAWAKKLFPERYHAPAPYPIAQNDPNQYPGYGGLIGELPLILAMIALSVKEEEVDQAIRHCVYGNGWRVHGLPRRRGWLDDRGVVVKVWCWPHPDQSMAPYRSTRDDLRNLERGYYGKIFD